MISILKRQGEIGKPPIPNDLRGAGWNVVEIDTKYCQMIIASSGRKMQSSKPLGELGEELREALYGKDGKSGVIGDEKQRRINDGFTTTRIDEFDADDLVKVLRDAYQIAVGKRSSANL